MAHRAEDFDAEIERTLPYYRAFHRETLRFARAVQPIPERWLDTGCGTGSLAALAREAFPATQFVLADPSADMVAQARAKLLPDERITILPPTGSTELGPGEGPGFDVITAVQSHHYLSASGRRAAVATCRGLLRDGGLFLVFENVRPSSPDALSLALRYWQEYQVDSGKSEAEARAHAERFDREYFPITIEAHLELLRDVGFSQVGLFWYSYLQAGIFALA